MQLADIHQHWPTPQLSGKSPAELEASRHKLSHSTDRDIVEIKLSYANAGSDEDALRRAW